MFHRLYSLAAILALTALCSCVDRSDYIIDEVNLNPSVALPLVTGSFALSDLMEGVDTAHVKVDPNGLIYFVYEEELQSQDIGDMFSIPNKSVSISFVLPGITLPPIPQDLRSDSINRVVDFGMSPEQIDEVGIKAGQIAYSTVQVPPGNLNYEVNVSLPTFVSPTGVPFNQ